MDLFPDGAHVRLQSRELGTYLYADEDGVGVSLSGNAASLNAAWKVHRIMHEGTAYVLLHGAAYGRYLAVSPDEAPPAGHRGARRVVQSDRDRFDPRPVMWRTIRGWGAGDDVVVRHDEHRNLRGNGRFRRWHKGVTVEDSTLRQSTMMRWVVKPVPTRATAPALQLPVPIPTPNVGLWRRLFRRRAVTVGDSLRMIWCVAADDDGNVDDRNWDNFEFLGRSVFSLKVRVAFRGGQVNANYFVLCVKAGHEARLTPLIIDLMPSQMHPMHIVALRNGSPGAAALVYPDVHAETP